MIKVNELRIDNFIYYEPFKGAGFEIIQVGQIPLKERSNSKPIQLTEEWLIRSGFIKYGEWFCYSNYPIVINISLTHKKTTYGANEEYEINHIEFVHTLQNLYFALTNTELTIN